MGDFDSFSHHDRRPGPPFADSKIRSRSAAPTSREGRASFPTALEYLYETEQAKAVTVSPLYKI